MFAAHIKTIERNIQEANAWLAFKNKALTDGRKDLIERYQWIDLRSKMWTPALNPGVPPFHMVNHGLALDAARVDRMPEWLPKLVEMRRQALIAEGIDPLASPSSPRGKILFSKYGDSVLDTAAESVSDLLFDGMERPSWDTWIWQSDAETLLAWIPADLIEKAQDGIEVTPVGNLRWVTHLDAPWIETLKNTSQI